jgi:hypothetical protein
MRRFWISALVGVVTVMLGLWGIVSLVGSNSEAAEVITGALGLLASIFSSPFIMEASLALIGLTILLTYNQYRRERDEQDEWVLLPREESADSSVDDGK